MPQFEQEIIRPSKIVLAENEARKTPALIRRMRAGLELAPEISQASCRNDTKGVRREESMVRFRPGAARSSDWPGPPNFGPWRATSRRHRGTAR